MLRVSQDAFHGPVRCSLHHLLDVVILGLEETPNGRSVMVSLSGPDQNVGGATHGLLQADRQVHHRHVGGGDAEGHAGQLAVNKQPTRGVRLGFAY